jgi:PLP dependent protein
LVIAVTIFVNTFTQQVTIEVLLTQDTRCLMSLSIEHNIAKVWQHIRAAEKKHHRRANSVQLIAVSKTRTAQCIRQAVEAGASHIGENYLREALEKQAALADLPITWHFIGPIQSNKTRLIAEHFDWVHSVDRLKIAARLSEQRPDSLPPLNICIQINVSGEHSKSGVKPDETEPLAEQISKLPNIILRGVMAVPAATENEQHQMDAFAQVSRTAVKLQQRHGTIDTLSMGMSTDMRAAIAQGATMVRIGTDIFGPRS